jgi:hypothetical protein
MAWGQERADPCALFRLHACLPAPDWRVGKVELVDVLLQMRVRFEEGAEFV